MATPPTLVAVYQVASFTTTTTSKTISLTCSAGDVLVCGAVGEWEGVTISTPTGGTGLSWTLQQSVVIVNQSTAYAWTCTAGSANAAATITLTSAQVAEWGGLIYRYSGSAGIGTSNKGNSATNVAPAVSLTTAANSAVPCIIGDFNANSITGRIWRTINGVTPTAGNTLETVAATTATIYTAYSASWTDTGAAGSVTAGMTTPGQAYSIIAVEVLGAAAAAGAAPRTVQVVNQAALTRAGRW